MDSNFYFFEYPSEIDRNILMNRIFMNNGATYFPIKCSPEKT